MSKPRIKRDAFSPTGYVCKSSELGGRQGTHPVIGSGETMEQAYKVWRAKKLSDPLRAPGA